jgi:phosphate transport system substrate-binding protein
MNKTATLVAGAVLVLSACSSGSKGGGEGSSQPGISGAGATFPAPIYTRWAADYRQQTGNQVNYQGIGSGGGIKQIESNTVDFGATDKPLKVEDLDKNGLIQFPAVIGGVVPVVNLPGIKPGEIRLTGQLLGDIFLGKVKSWNAPALTALNPGVKLPATPITVVHRSDGSGTTFIFATYLADKNPEWSSKVGASDSLSWPTGIGGKGNDGVAAFVKQTVGSIGYVEYAYARANSLPFTLLQNKDGGWPAPTAPAFAAAAANADWKNAPGNFMLLLDQPGKDAWPISATTFILMHKQAADAAKSAAVLKFFDWAYTNGDQAASSTDYVPLPQTVKDLMRQQWSQIQADGKPVYTPK